ncbi:MAG: flavodoxin family protein [Clostridia bacterium]|nr:flavodoxin family protein [Clostridia bacterium]
MKKVLILSGSPRKGGNSDTLCDEFARGAKNAGNQVEKIRLQEKKIANCLGCYYCAEHGGKCVMQDDMSKILEKMLACDVLVLASPVYFYSVCAQMKAVIDRTVARWTEIKYKDLYYIMTSAEDSATVMDGTLACFRGFRDCLDGCGEKGVLYGKGLENKTDVLARKELMTIAYEMGEQV